MGVMMRSNDGIARPQWTSLMTLPAQAPPVPRNDWPAESAYESGDGVQAAQSQCSNLRGLARQMCYATVYGESV
jgi:hypothetical protein